MKSFISAWSFKYILLITFKYEIPFNKRYYNSLKMTGFYDSICNMLIRPARQTYSDYDLGISYFI